MAELGLVKHKEFCAIVILNKTRIRCDDQENLCTHKKKSAICLVELELIFYRKNLPSNSSGKCHKRVFFNNVQLFYTELKFSCKTTLIGWT